MNQKYGFETLQVRAGQEIDPVSKGTAVPIYQSTAYTFDSMEYGAELFELKRPGNIYTRITNTTNEVFEKRMAALEGGVAAVSTASGQSAVFLSITNICGPGDNIVAQPYLYGGTFTMFAITLRDMGIEVRFAKSDSVADLEALVDGRTKALFLENIGNPAFNIPDYEPIVEMARRKGICVMVDNTFGMGGYLFRPFEWGCNVSVHSATKWICGHGTALGGVVVDGGNFDWTPEKYPLLAAPQKAIMVLYIRKYLVMLPLQVAYVWTVSATSVLRLLRSTLSSCFRVLRLFLSELSVAVRTLLLWQSSLRSIRLWRA